MNRYIVFTPPLQGAHERFVHDVKERFRALRFSSIAQRAHNTPHTVLHYVLLCLL